VTPAAETSKSEGEDRFHFEQSWAFRYWIGPIFIQFSKHVSCRSFVQHPGTPFAMVVRTPHFTLHTNWMSSWACYSAEKTQV
jgi:hypothetical protein